MILYSFFGKGNLCWELEGEKRVMNRIILFTVCKEVVKIMLVKRVKRLGEFFVNVLGERNFEVNVGLLIN